jgi:hypothetical protein
MTDAGLERVKQDLLGLADFAYGRLRTRLEGLTDEEYFWEPAADCWSVRRSADGRYHMDGPPTPEHPAPFTTIAWRVCHLIDMLAGQRNATWIGVTPLGRLARDGEPGTARQAMRELDRAFGLFRSHVAAVAAATVDTDMGEVAAWFAENNRAASIHRELDELIHHAAEVALLRDLYRVTETGTGSIEPAARSS